MTDDTSRLIRAFITERFPTATPDTEIGDDTSFLESGLIDSVGVLELVDFLEQQFGISVEDTELVPENLDSIHNICVYLESKMRTGSTDPGGPAR